MLTAGGAYKGRVSASIFPAEWFPRPEPEYLTRWRHLESVQRGTWVFVDTQGRPILVTVRKTKAFIDLSRGARSQRNLSLLGELLKGLLQESSEPSVQQRRSLDLSHLDQGLGDLIRVVRSGRESGGAPRGSRARSRAARHGSVGAAERSTTREG